MVDRIIGYGVALHEGHLFGWLNQLFNLSVALILSLMSIAALVIWLKRRPPATLGLPARIPDRRLGKGTVGVLLLAGLLLPELGVSLLLVAALSATLRKDKQPLAGG